ncbi:MAG: SNF2 helicase associated domain-containing protein [Christensenellales bacterium]
MYEAAPLVAKVYISDFEFGIVARVEASYDDNEIDILSEMAPQTDFVRDWDAENALRGVLVRYFPDYPDLHLSDEDEIYDFLTEGVKELFGYAEVLISGDMKKLSVRRSPRLKVGVRLSGDLLRLDVTSDDYTKEEIDAILKAYREKRRYIRLGGGFVSLEDNSIEALGDILDVAKLSGGEMVMPRYCAVRGRRTRQRIFLAVPRQRVQKTAYRAESVRNADVEVPESLKDVMRNYQKTGFRWLKMLSDNGFGGILADDMGLGKSLQVIALLLSSKSRAIVVCPTTLMLNWTSEIAKFAPSLKAVAVMGGQEERKDLSPRRASTTW